jgi:branched-chain amino acid transport system substrate-binding protein
MKKRLSLLLHVPALAAILAVAGCGDRARDENTLRIGAIVEMTGDMPAVGARPAMRRARGQRAECGGGITVAGKPYKVELLVEDNAAKPDQSAAAANKLITQDEVLAIVGPNASLGAIPASEIAEASKTLLITPWSTNPKTTLDNRTGLPKKYVFRACFHRPFQGQVLARFITEKLGAKTAASPL